MQRLRPCGLLGTLLVISSSVGGIAADAAGAGIGSTASAPQPESGWRLLFDGQTSKGWRGFRKATFPDRGWVIENGVLRKMGSVQGGDIVTEETFGDFELSWEWRLGKGGNNGVKYFILEERGGAVGHEYQMVDDSGVRNPKYQTASFYDVLPPRRDRKPTRIGEWNESRVIVRGNHVEHWLNGERVLEYELGSPEVLAAVAASKFKEVKGFGTKVRGRILLTDHGSEACFRNVRIR